MRIRDLVVSWIAGAVLLPGAGPDFQKDIAPVLAKHCAACHAGRNKASDYSVESQREVIAGGKKHGKAVVGGHPELSPLLHMIKGEKEPRMPIGSDLAKADIERIEAWVRAMPSEAAGQKPVWRWPFEKPARPAIPSVNAKRWTRNAIDDFVLANLEANRLAPAAEADKRTLARRAYYDLIGLPPTPEEMNAFLSDGSATAWETLIDKLLADPRYGERWGRHWLDLVRYGETSGLEGDGPIGNAWRYRDWVVDAFNKDLPYDRFVHLQLAGADEHSKTRNNYAPDMQGHVPLGFLRLAPWDRSNLVADEVRQNYLSEITTTVSSVFLGLSVGCARCHDHKYDPIPQKDYYRLQAFFNAIQVENVEVPFKDPDFRKKAEGIVKELQGRLKDGPEKLELDRFEAEALKQFIAARKKLATAADYKLTREDLRLDMRLGEKSLFGKQERGLHAELLEDANRTQDPEEKEPLEKLELELMKRLQNRAERFDTLRVDDVRAELGRTASKIFAAEQRDKHRELSEKLEVYRRRIGRWSTNALTVRNVPGPPNGPMIAPTRLLVRGDYRQPGEAVEAGFLTAIAGKAEPAVIEQDRYRQFPTRGWRTTLAKWIASPENPLTARVMVNRIWQFHFGRGIVGTPSDFGANGERPTHPELVDWLAHRFIDEKWSIKSMHRLMMTSAAYRQSSENAKYQSNTADAENKLLWRFPRRRLEAEEIRDSILYLSGRLNTERGGPSIFPPLPEDLADFARYGRGGGLMWEPNERPEDALRRSIYIFHRRSLPLPSMAAFDAPVFSESCDRRSSTTTPLQALSMMNGYLVQDEAAHLAKRAGTLEQAVNLVLQRRPTEEERKHFAGYSGSLESICRVLLNSNEFLYLD
ncbi:MAG: PSD1 domain-containing protein [Bryobacterales bacterium]|nr:PSD1 domain-containing protein [Bryobacterales bacterium]